MKLKELTVLHRSRSSSSSTSTHQILPSNHITSSISSPLNPHDHALSSLPLKTWKNVNLVAIIQSILTLFSFPTTIINSTPTCRWLSMPTRPRSIASLGRKVTGTLFGSKKGHITFAVQAHPQTDPILVVELATSTTTLVKEMSSGLVRIMLECERRWGSSGGGGSSAVRLHEEPRWIMYCNGRMCGYAVVRACGEVDWRVLSVLQTVSMGAGVIPGVVEEEKEVGRVEEPVQVMYMRAGFERVVGGRDSEAYYMVNPDKMGGPELSIFLLRI